MSRRIRRDLRRFGLPMLQVTSKAKDKRIFAKHVAAVESAIDNSQIEVLRALIERRITLDQLVDAERHHELGGKSALSSIAKREPLWEAMELAVKTMGKSEETRKRYAQAMRNLKRKRGRFLTERATVGDLLGVDWNGLQAEWGNSPSDWMHLRRFISAFLTKQLGDVYHEFRRDVMKRIPTAQEVEREPDITPGIFWEIISHAREDVRAAYVTIVATGMRRGEYLRCTRSSLKPNILAVQVPGRKTKESSGTVMVDESLWPWIEAGIPSPVAYKRLRELWIDACLAAGVEGIHLHDLRHAFGQWSTNEGVSEAHVQKALRHSTASQTRRYVKQKAKGEVSRAIGRALRSAPEQTQGDVKSMSGKTERSA